MRMRNIRIKQDIKRIITKQLFIHKEYTESY